MENMWWGKILANHAGEKLLVGNNLVNKQQSMHMAYTFSCISEYRQGKFWQMAHNSPNSPIFSPTKILPCTVVVYILHASIIM